MPPLTRDRILRAAVRLADKDGFESLSMRKLGRACGVEAMSLYNHVANKNDLLSGMLDLVLEEVEFPTPGGDWQATVRTSAVSMHEAFHRHPWAPGLMMSAAAVSTRRLRYMDALLGTLREAGFSAETTYHAYHALDSHMLGYALWEAGHSVSARSLPPDFADTFLRDLPREEYPHFYEHVDQHLASFGHGEEGAFELGLDLIIAGLERIRTAR